MSNEQVNPCHQIGCEGKCCQGNLIIDVELRQIDSLMDLLRARGATNNISCRPSFSPGLFIVTITGDCPFLDENYSCTTYDSRPRGCREFTFNSRECQRRRCLPGF